MLYCKAKGEVLDIFIKESQNPECYKDVYIKIRNEKSFFIASGKLKNIDNIDCKSNYETNFKSNLDLPVTGDDVNYLIGDNKDSIVYGDKFILSLNNTNNNLNNCIKPQYVDYYEFYNKCNLTGEIKDIHRKELRSTMDTHLKIDTGDGYYNAKTIEGFYYGNLGYGVLGIELKFPKLLEGGGVRFFKKGDSVNYIVDEDTGKILKEGYDESLESCNISNQKLSDFKFEGGLKPMDVVNLNMKKYREYKGIEEPKTQEEKQENQFIVGFKFVDYSGGFMISLFMLLLFFTAVLKNFVSKQKLAF